MTLLTTENELQECYLAQRNAFNAAPYTSLKYRKGRLKELKSLLIKHQQKLANALAEDFGCRSETESVMVDLITSVGQINYTLSRLKRWMKPQRRSIGMMFFPATAEVHYQPLGVIGIVTPWNYPIFLALGPLIAALAAGNRAMIKMSEFTPHTNKALAEVMAEGFETDEVAVIEGEVDVSVAFTKLSFDHILFTGSGQVGKHVLHAAADNLVPVTLELGGKSPCILSDDYSVYRFVKNFLISKTLNSGQTCVAPDTVYCHRSKVQELINELKKQYVELFPEESRAQDITSVINIRQWQRIEALAKDATDKGATMIPLSDGYDAEQRTMPVTLVMDTSPEMTISDEEIFGPLLPIIAYDDIEEVIKDINSQPRPLALYLFSNNLDLQRKILYYTHSGGVCLNDAAFHVGVDDLPFGGVGPSGMGSYHADEGFKTFSHAKSVLIRGRINLTPLFAPPYGRGIHRLITRFFMR